MINKFSFLTSCLLLLTSISVVYLFISSPDVIVVDKGFDRFPVSFDEYSGEDIKMDDRVVKELDTDVYIFRNYIGKNIVTLYIGYYGTGKGGRTGHNPNACYPSSGYAILDEKKVALPVNFFDGKVAEVVVTRLLIAKNDEKQIVYHWYQSSADKVLASGIEQNIHRFKTRLLYNRNDGAFVRVSATVKENIPDTEGSLLVFIKKIIPLIEQYWPVEKEKNAQL